MLRVARAVKAGDVVAEAEARADLAMAGLRRNLEAVRESGVRLSPAQVAELAGLVSTFAGPAAGPNPLEVLRSAAVAAGMEGDCDRCGAEDGTLSGSLDLTGTASPPMTLVRLCAACRAEGGS